MSPREQIEKLRQSARLSWLPRGLFVLTLALIALALLSGYGVLFAAGAFTGLAALASRQAAPHWRNAIQATRTGTRSKGTLSVAVTLDPTSFDDYVATVRDASGCTWRFSFNPQYWAPPAGDYEVETYYVRGVAWPALLVADGGIVFPAFTPVKLAEPA